MTIVVKVDFRSEPDAESIVQGTSINIHSDSDSLYQIEDIAKRVILQLEERYNGKWTWHLPVHRNAVKKGKNELVV